MKLFPVLVTFLLLIGSVSAECRDKGCMPDSHEFVIGNVTQFTFYYDSIFEVGTNWFLILEGRNMEDYWNFSFEFEEDLSREAHLEDRDSFPETQQRNDSISFPGSTFSEEEFHKMLFVNITNENGNLVSSFVLKLHINKPPSQDMFYLWGGMTVFWLGIGVYVIYLSNKFQELSDKSGLGNGDRKKN